MQDLKQTEPQKPEETPTEPQRPEETPTEPHKPEETPPEAQLATQAPAPEPPSLEAIVAERDRLAAEKAGLLDQFLRLRAEFENFRKRIERERFEFRQHASAEVIRQLLPVVDGLERALASAGTDAGEEFHAGVELIARQLHETLQRCGLEPLETVGQKFDPHLHQAVETVETTEHEDHTILEEWQRGYKFRNRLLRPAMVKVAVRPESP